MSYTIGPSELEAIDRFAVAAHGLGLIEQAPPLRLRNRGQGAKGSRGQVRSQRKQPLGPQAP